MKLWVFGQSMCLPHKLREEQGWPFLLSIQLGIEYNNFAQPGADNFFIYHCFLENYKNIAKDDLVVIGWSHYSRKSFVLDRNNPKHTTALVNSLHYQTPTKEFFRSNNLVPDDKHKWLTLRPIDSGSGYYDTWFNDYYSEHEQKCNFQSYLDSVQSRVIGQYIPFYFSKESIADVDTSCRDTMLEFVIENKVEISKQDYHLNAKGHAIWAERLYNNIL